MRGTSWLTLALLFTACGPSEGDVSEAPDPVEAAAPQPSASVSTSTDEFILCRALEPHREELASMLGFTADLDEPFEGISECIVRGGRFSYLRISLVPRFVRSIEMHAASFDRPSNPAPEVGPDAVFVEGGTQPHVLFSVAGRFIDVDAEDVEPPMREELIALASRVRALLEDANR